jgi:hypothetical protein
MPSDIQKGVSKPAALLRVSSSRHPTRRLPLCNTRRRVVPVLLPLRRVQRLPRQLLLLWYRGWLLVGRGLLVALPVIWLAGHHLRVMLLMLRLLWLLLAVVRRWVVDRRLLRVLLLVTVVCRGVWGGTSLSIVPSTCEKHAAQTITN